MARTVGKDAAINMVSPTPPSKSPSAYSKPSQKGVNIQTGAPAPHGRAGEQNRFQGGTKLTTPSPSKK